MNLKSKTLNRERTPVRSNSLDLVLPNQWGQDQKGSKQAAALRLVEQNEMLNTVTVVGRKNQVTLSKLLRLLFFREISSLVAKGVEDIVAQQAGVQKTTDGIQIRGARVYETEYLVDGISAQDPGGTGGGVSVSSSSLQSINLMTGGASAEYGGGSSEVVNTTIKEGGQKLRWALNTVRIISPAASTPIVPSRLVRLFHLLKEIALFTSANAILQIIIWRYASAKQLLFPGNPTM